ncbi:MAG: hypothetical protein JRC93_12180 [Deltaproteobacteria bacterium]|nr:hypothetical protein [Deltaproteobacteria bacterium]
MIYSIVNDCIISEKERGLSEATIKELKRYLHEFAGDFQKKLTDIENLTSDFLRQYVEHRVMLPVLDILPFKYNKYIFFAYNSSTYYIL